MATVETLVQNIIKIRSFVGIYLAVPVLNAKQKAALATNLIQLDKNIAALVAALEVAPGAAPAVAAVEVVLRTKPLTYDEEYAILIAEQDKLLIAAGRPAGHDGAERGATTLGEIVTICEQHDLPILLAQYRALVNPNVSQ